MIKNVLYAFILAGVVFCCNSPLMAQDAASQALFTSIGDDLKSGDATAFSKWFADDMEVDILGSTGVCSKSQARQVMKNFYSKYTPKLFSIVHLSGAIPLRYCIGTLYAGGERFRVTLYVKTTRDVHTLQQIRVEKE